MRIIYAKYGIDLCLEENKITTIVIENPLVMSEVIRDISRQVNGEDGEWILSEQDKIFSIEKSSQFINNPLMVNSNEKRILTRLYKELFEQANTLMYEEYTQINSYIVSFLVRLLDTVPYHLDMEIDMDLTGILKLYGVKMESDGVGVLEVLIDYLRALSSICNIHVIWILNVKQFLTVEEVQQLYEFCFYEKILLINLEGQKNYNLEHEKCVIIDKDLCIIDTSSN
ncbi:type II-A CRISPR-associated protein Csn2 [Lachnoanaerobaculum saburreum]|jgi:CRISPR-associated protein, csn2 family|uniref:CRISPR-associated protein, Csn2 family n=1 Tax=Lachnoanaerobaculum saburreum TaxID=467210 RepID=A0A133ZJZ6_9FIRM|nr:type II-A CRISPR-associated protein Csn2 [Lachnoanaerobaculum saburreum]KXB55768.1 CRISPR-associated protein, Csn2 family [Lachnoanaerobaculum saburreum]